MAIQTLNYCTRTQLECSAFPNTAFLCVPVSIVESGLAFIRATIESVRPSTCTDYCGPCGFVYTITYDDVQLVPGTLLVPTSIISFICEECLVSIFESLSLTFVDSETIDFTQSGTDVTAEAVISADANNCLEARIDGLYVPCPGANFIDTTSIDFTVVGNDVSADVIISPDPNNALVSLANGLFVDENILTVVDSTTVDLTITGTAPQSLTAAVLISAAANNAVIAVADGLFVDENILTVTDTASVNLTITGTAPQDITAAVNISADLNNCLEERIDGLFVECPDAALITSVDDTSSVNLTVALGELTADVVVSPDGSNLLESRANGLWVPAQDGWIPFNVTLTRVDNTHFTIPGDFSGVLHVGDKIKLNNPTLKYFYVSAQPVFALGVTTVEAIGGDDYLLAVGALTNPFFTHAQSFASGFPFRFNFTASPTGFSVPPTYKAQFWINAVWVTVTFSTSVNGTSNNTDFNISLPKVAATDAGNQWVGSVGQATDNGASIDTAFIQIQSGAAVAVLSKSAAVPAWTAALAKGANFTISYPIL